MSQQKKHVAIIGAGISGLVIAQKLSTQGHQITLFEKSRGVSGRTSTRYSGDYEFDHGAPYFTVRSQEFKSFVNILKSGNILSEWKPSVKSISLDEKPFKVNWFEPHYVGYGRMNNIAKYLLQQIVDQVTVNLGIEITEISSHPHIQLMDKNGQYYTGFDSLIMTAPAPQAYNLLPQNIPFRENLQNVILSPSYSLMIGTQTPLKSQIGLYQCQDDILEKIIINSSKVARPKTGTSIVVQSTSKWAYEHIDADLPPMQDILLNQTQKLLNDQEIKVDYITTHRWRYAKVDKALDAPYLWDNNTQIGVCADWCQIDDSNNNIQGIEAAFLSAFRLGEFLNTIN